MGDDLSPPRGRVVAVVQARMSSSRLPGKVLEPMAEDSVLAMMLRRLRRARELDGIAVATSVESSDDRVAHEASRLGVKVVRGPLADVLARYVLALERVPADAVVRITADCPFVDPEVVDAVVRQWRLTGADYVANTLEPRSFPDGFDVEVIAAQALRRAADQAVSPGDREHVTAFLRRHPELFRITGVRLEPSSGGLRVTLDTAQDLSDLRALTDRVGPDASLHEVLKALGRNGTHVMRDDR